MLWAMEPKDSFAHISIGSTTEIILFLNFGYWTWNNLKGDEDHTTWITDCTLYLQFDKKAQKAKHAKYCRHSSDLR